MSVAKRFLSGSLASVASILVVLTNQLAIVPLLLSHWSVDDFGIWLAVQALMAFGTVVSAGCNTYFEFEFLKIGPINKLELSRLLHSGLPVLLIFSVGESVLLLLFVWLGLLDPLLAGGQKLKPENLRSASELLMIQSATWCVFTTIPSLYQRALGPLGYYARNTWIYVAGAMLSTIAVAVSVMMGADYLWAGISQAVVYAIFASITFFDFRRSLQKEEILMSKPCSKVAFSAVIPTFALATKSLLTIVQQQGLRVLLSSSLGLKELASFASMRTVSNFALQGIGIIVNPITPELMRFSHQKDSAKVQGTFMLIWFFTVILLSATLIALQYMAPWLFGVWTLGKVRFNPTVFAVISISMLVFGLSQPALVVIRGANKVRLQLSAALIGGILVAIPVFIFSSRIGLLAAAFGIIAAELTTLILSVAGAKKWLATQGLVWPKRAFALLSVYVTAGSLCILLISFDREGHWALIQICLVAQGVVIFLLRHILFDHLLHPLLALVRLRKFGSEFGSREGSLN